VEEGPGQQGTIVLWVLHGGYPNGWFIHGLFHGKTNYKWMIWFIDVYFMKNAWMI